MALLNTEGGSLGLLDKFEILHMPMLMDHKYFGLPYNSCEIDIPKAEVGLISGGITDEMRLRIAEKMRRQCSVIVALGTCAAYGGIPASIDSFEDEELFGGSRRGAEETDSETNSVLDVPKFLGRTFALDEKIDVDITLPGCPPHPDRIAAVLESVINRKSLDWPLKAVCDSCPAKREGKGGVHKIRRFVKNARYQVNKPLSEMRCLLEQGFLCMGPVTLAGCAGTGGGLPRCIEARVPCRGCHGPVRKGGNQLLDILNALASNGIDTKDLAGRFLPHLFCGARAGLAGRRSVRTAPEF
jgi:F420-non-reducing hydrogenase small subunit